MVQYDTKPPGWGSDSLSQFIDTSTHNTFATFYSYKTEYELLSDIHSLFEKIVPDFDKNGGEWFASLFLIRSHAAFLAGARLALGGQVPESYLALRGCLENALYGFYLSSNRRSPKTWLDRHEDQNAKRAVRKEFTIRKLMECLKLGNQKVQGIASLLYERTIDHGAHPNERGIMSVTHHRIDDDKETLISSYLIGDSVALQLSMKSVAQVGLCSLSIFEIIL